MNDDEFHEQVVGERPAQKPRMVLGFMIDPDAKTILLKTRRKSPFSEKWNGISGRVKTDEKPNEAMSRKFLDDAGLVVDADTFKEVALLTTPNHEVHVFVCYGNVYAAKQPAIFFPLSSNWSREPVVDNLKWIIPLLTCPMVVAPIEVSTK